MPHRPRVLILSRDPRRVAVLTHRCAQLGHAAVPAHEHEEGAEALLRVKPRAALVDLQHPASESRLFLAVAAEVGVRVVLLGDGVEGPVGGGVVAFGGGVSPIVTEPATDGLAPLLARALAS